MKKVVTAILSDNNEYVIIAAHSSRFPHFVLTTHSEVDVVISTMHKMRKGRPRERAHFPKAVQPEEVKQCLNPGPLVPKPCPPPHMFTCL